MKSHQVAKIETKGGQFTVIKTDTAFVVKRRYWEGDKYKNVTFKKCQSLLESLESICSFVRAYDAFKVIDRIICG